mmetsp:Transcript_33163/g.80209  ORF Transcript_33163/g.80209 Transcript_33163/m.80209 type:complete len:291 (+) Transcript_33163:1120-1992(+)
MVRAGIGQAVGEVGSRGGAGTDQGCRAAVRRGGYGGGRRRRRRSEARGGRAARRRDRRRDRRVRHGVGAPQIRVRRNALRGPGRNIRQCEDVRLGLLRQASQCAGGATDRQELLFGHGVASVILQELYVSSRRAGSGDGPSAPVVVPEQQGARGGGDAVGGRPHAVRGIAAERTQERFRHLRQGRAIQRRHVQFAHPAVGAVEEGRFAEHVRFAHGHRPAQSHERRSSVLHVSFHGRIRALVAGRVHAALHGVVPRGRAQALPRRLRSAHRGANSVAPERGQRPILRVGP